MIGNSSHTLAKLTAMSAVVMTNRIGASLKWRRAAPRNSMTHSAQQFESERFPEYVGFAVTMINNDGSELETLLPGTLRNGRVA